MANVTLSTTINFSAMDELINHLLRLGQLNQPQIELIKIKFHYKEIEKDSFYEKAGDIPKEIIFISKAL